MNINKAYKFRIYPNKTQKDKLNKTFGCCRFVWNNWVNTFNYFSKGEEFLSVKELRELYPWMQEVSAGALQQVERNFVEFKKQFFSKVRKKKLGRPKFKSKKISKASYRLPNQKFRIEDNKIILEKIGKVKIILDREIPDSAKFLSVTISKDSVGDYYVSILVEENYETKLKATNKIVGIDLGLKDFCILSDESKINNPRFFVENQNKLKRTQQHLSRKKKSSKRYQKQKIKVAKIHRKIARQREYFLHNLSSKLIAQYDLIAMENLNIDGMKKIFGKSVSDVSWFIFISQLKYKALWNNKIIQQIGRFQPSTKLCSECQYIKNDLTLSDRSWTCPQCKKEHDRDINASRSILIQAVGVNTAQQTWRNCKSKELDSKVNFEEALIKIVSLL